MEVVQMSVEPKVRILADVSVETRDKLNEVAKKLDMTRKDLFDKMIEEYHKRYVTGN